MSAAAVATEAAWHDVECGSYAADLSLWRSLAREHGGPVLDVGCGTGRVALDLAAAGHTVVGIDADPELTAALNERARGARLPARGIAADARSFALEGVPAVHTRDRQAQASAEGSQADGFRLAVVPMQVAQLLGGRLERARMLDSVAAHLVPGGVIALAIADPFEAVEPGDARPPLPDVLEIDGWVLSSTPVAVRDEGDAVAIDRVRQAVSPAGDLTEELSTVVLDNCSQVTLEEEGQAVGLTVVPARCVPPTDEYIGSAVVMLEKRR